MPNSGQKQTLSYWTINKWTTSPSNRPFKLRRLNPQNPENTNDVHVEILEPNQQILDNIPTIPNPAHPEDNGTTEHTFNVPHIDVNSTEILHGEKDSVCDDVDSKMAEITNN